MIEPIVKRRCRALAIAHRIASHQTMTLPMSTVAVVNELLDVGFRSGVPKSR